MRTKLAIQRDLLGATVLQVRNGRAVSRGALARALGVAPSTAGVCVDQLIADGYVDESGLEQGPAGRPRRTLATLGAAGWFAGVEFNAERVQAVRVDFSGKLVASQVKWLPDEGDARSVVTAIKGVVSALAKGAEGPLLAVGAGAPGIVDPASGVSGGYPFIPGWNGVPLASSLRERFGVPVTVENNLRAIALAERWFGEGRHLHHYVILGPRSGFGVAIVQDGRLIGGAHHAAGEIGRWPWRAAGGGELQDELSAPAVWRRLAGASPRSRIPEDLHAALADFAGAHGLVWESLVADFAQVIGCLQLLVDTEVFFLHGPLTALGARFCGDLEQAIRAGVPALSGAAFKIVPSKLGDAAGALGAASLAMEAWAPVPPA